VRHDDPAGAAAEGAHTAFLATRTFGSLDGLRALCILGVLWHHCGTSNGAAPFLLRRGYLGVDAFFVLSGFLIVTLLLRERDATGGISLRGFYARRALRIFPLYAAVLLVCAAHALTSRSPEALRLRQDLPWAFVYLTNWVPTVSMLGITWSLAVEEQFYLVWPSTMALSGRRASRVLVVALAVCVGLQLAHGPLDLPLHQFLWKSSYTPILLGVGLAHVLHDPRGHAFVRRQLGARHAPLVAGALLLGLLAFPGDLSGLPRLAIHLTMLALLAACVVREDHLAAPLLRAPLVARVGAISYGIYLLHPFCRHVLVLATGLPSGPALFLLAVPLSVLVAEVSYRAFEARFLALRSRFRPAAPRAAAVPVALTSAART
jgi:peptidoglycan/LPS O-acetylase OafA/YrhL